MNWHPLQAPLRSLLFVPGDNPKMLRKAWNTAADAVILDLEDAVPLAAKTEARAQVHKILAAAPPSKPRMLVRINAFATADWQEDLEAVVGPEIQGIVLPKCDAPQTVRAIDRVLQRREKLAGLEPGGVRLFLLIESAKGLLNMGSMFAASDRTVGLILGGEDFCLDMGISRTQEGTELSYPRAALAVCAHAHGCYAVDTIYDNYKDPEGLLQEARLAKALGFSGKLAIHPTQIEPIHAAFAPSAQEVWEANRVLEAFNQAQAAGTGVTVLDGKMIDRPIVERARRIVALASQASER